jgi:hypothetical protein
MAMHPPRWIHNALPSVGRDAESTAAGIYGVIVSAAVMAASHATRVVVVAVAVLVTLVVYWSAERYARLVAERIHDGRRPSWHQVRQELTGLYGAVLAALTCSTVLLCLAGWEIGRDGRLTTRERLVSAGVAGLFGLSMVLLKALLH